MTTEDDDLSVAEIDDEIGRFGKLRLVEIVKDIGAIDSAIWWPDLKWAATHMKHIARCAVVTDKGWIGAITRAAAAVLTAALRVFRSDERRVGNACVSPCRSRGSRYT